MFDLEAEGEKLTIIKDKLIYLLADKGGFHGVKSHKTGISFDVDGCGTVTVKGGGMPIEDFNDLCISWLCLFDPLVIAQDACDIAKTTQANTFSECEGKEAVG